MTHYLVTVRLSKARLAQHNNNMDDALAEILAPFDEGTKDERFLVFNDLEDEYRKTYETDECERIQLDDGTTVWPWDERFRVPGTLGTGTDTHTPPENMRMKVPFREIYADFETFCKDYQGSKRDLKTGRYGYWRNPNAKWDWYSIGGRWRGFYDNKTDVIWTSELQLEKFRRQAFEKATEFYDHYVEWLDNPDKKESNPFDSPRYTAMTLGLVEVDETGTAQPQPGVQLIPWSSDPRQKGERRQWIDVCKRPGRAEFVEQFSSYFNPLRTYAALDDNGWHEPGEMGWWGSSSDTPASMMEFSRSFVENFLSGENALLVVVDCHI